MIWLEVDPNIVKPGLTPLLILVGLALAMVLLFFSMRRQFRKINVPPGPGEPVAPTDGDAVRRSTDADPASDAGGPIGPTRPSAAKGQD